MIFRLLADAVLVFHLAFVAFVVLGAALVALWPKLLLLHVAAVAWGVLVELSGLICPLTPLEVHLRQLGGEAGYSGGFIQHYVAGVLYPAGLTRTVQVWLGIAAAAFNVGMYSYIILRRRRRSRRSSG